MTTLAVFLWLTATVGHFLLTSRYVRRVLPSDVSFDEAAFATVLGGVGTLSVILHVLATTTGLNLTSGLAALLCWHLLLWTVTPSSAPKDAASAASSSPNLAIAEIAAAAALAGILFTWIDIASQSSAVVGTDANHYHVPVAINLALGANLFGLPATPHSYPMAGSLLEAWFIVPFTGPLIVDLAMCLPFLLLAVSMNWIFRLTTGESGLAWATWVVLAVFSAPLFRLSSLISADLWFASAFVAMTAVLTSVWARRTWRISDVALSALALGLLAGTKTTGTPAAALLLGMYLTVEIIRHVVLRDRPRLWPSHGFPSALGAAALMLAAGGIWWVRNWQQFGSPIAPWGLTVFGVSVFSGESPEPSTHLSVLGDLQSYSNYDLSERMLRFVRIWMGAWFVPALWLIAIVPVDLVLAFVRRQAPIIVASRFLLLLSTIGVGGVLLWMLVGAPWTSLEWTRGLSLRYALPVGALLPLIAFIGLFPLSWRWFKRKSIVPSASAALIALSSLTFYTALDPQRSRHVNVPSISLVGFALGLGVVLTARWVFSQPRRLTVVMMAFAMAFGIVWAPIISARAREAYTRDVAREAQERTEFARSGRPDSAARAAYFVALAAEEAAGRLCERRRFFLMVRFDEPMTLQSPAFTNQVFHASRDVNQARRAGPLAACDYIIASPAFLETDKATSLIAALARGAEVEKIGTVESLVIMRRREP